MRPSRDMTTQCERPAGRGLRALLAADWGCSQNCAPYMGSGRGWLAGDWPSMGGVLSITAAVWTAGFYWWRSGNKKRTQNASEYMLVLAVCLVSFYQRSDQQSVQILLNLPDIQHALVLICHTASEITVDIENGLFQHLGTSGMVILQL